MAAATKPAAAKRPTLQDEESIGSQPIYVWEVPVRVTHWLIVLSIVVLGATGLYIHAP